MEYLIPLLIVVLVAVVVAGVAWLLSRRSSSGGAGASGGAARPRRASLAQRVSADGARAASTRLDQETHREVYRLIAAGRTAEAITAYRRTTGAGTFDAMLDVQALAAFPQIWEAPTTRGPVPSDASPDGMGSDGAGPGGAGSGGAGSDGAESEQGAETTTSGQPSQAGQPGPTERAGGPSGRRVPPGDIADATDLVVPQDWVDGQLPADRPFELEVVRDETTVRVSSDDLPPFLRDQLTAMVRDGRVEDAALELSAHTVLTAEEALQFLHILQREQGTDD